MARETTEAELEAAEKELKSALSELTGKYRSLADELDLIKNLHRDTISIQSRINKLEKLKESGEKQYINESRKRTNIARSLNSLYAELSRSQEVYTSELNKLSSTIRDRIRAEANKINELLDRTREEEIAKAETEYIEMLNKAYAIDESITRKREEEIAKAETEYIEMLNKAYAIDESITRKREEEIAKAETKYIKMLDEAYAMDKKLDKNRQQKAIEIAISAIQSVGNALLKLRDKIYELQAKLGTTFDTAVDVGAGALTNIIASYFSGGPQLGFQDTINAVNAYKKEFGTILTRGAAKDIAQAAKQFGADINTFVQAQRAFLTAGGLGTQEKFITQFRAAGLTASQALSFAAENANLVAIAGSKYADSLARAAANAQRIGVSLSKTEDFANNLVSDFEGGLERFSELRAMGVEVDFNRLATVAGIGTPEEVFNELSKELGGNRALLENIQKNRFLKVAIEKDLGLSIADVTRLATGGAGLPKEKTQAEQIENGTLQALIKWGGPIISGIGSLALFINLNTAATAANTLALMKSASIGSLKELFTSVGGLGTVTKGIGGGLIGTTIGTGIAAATGGNVTNAAIGGGIGSIAGIIGAALAPETGGLSLLLPLITSGIGSLIGGRIGTEKATGGLITGPGTATSDNIMTPTSPGEFVVNAKATQTYGTDFLNRINTGTQPKQEATTVTNTVNVDVSKLEAKLDKLAHAMANVKIQMSGYDVGNVSLNDRTPLFTASPSRVVG